MNSLDNAMIDSSRTLAALASALAAVLLLGEGGCLGDRCGPGEIREGDTCRPVAPDKGASDAGDDGLPSGDGPADNLGQSCLKSKECLGKADFCVVMPGATVGYCTYQNCTLSPDSCPEPYTCMDISQYVPGKPNLCIKL